MSIYSQNILEHYKEPQNKWRLETCDCEKKQVNRSCGDQITVFVKLTGNWEEIEKVTFDWEGCAISIAAASMLSEELPWMKVEKVLKLWLEEIKDLLWVEIWANRIKCSLLALETIQSCLKKES